MARKDGKKIKGTDGFMRMAALLVGEDRVSSTCYYTHEVLAKKMDDFIARKKAEEGIEYTYRDICIAGLVRVFYLRPQLNRFVYKGTFYQRNFIDVAMAMHKSLKTGEQETTIKCRFTGKETIREVKEKVDKEIIRAVTGDNGTDAFSGGFLGKMPTWVLRFILSIMKVGDRLGLFSDKFMFETSPMHASILFVDLKSIHLAPVWHHLYNFGNCGFTCTMGKEKLVAYADPKTMEISAQKVVELGIGEDERFIDGLTYSHMVRTINRIIDNLEILERVPEDDEVRAGPLNPYQKKQAVKLAKRMAKKQAKVSLRAERSNPTVVATYK